MDKGPVQRAREVYRQEFCPRSFDEDFYLHLNNPHAIIYKDANNLALLYPVKRSAPYARLTNPSTEESSPDCWWVYLLSGDFSFLLSLLPYDLEYIGWERDNIPRSYKLSQVKRWILQDHTSTQILSTAEADSLGFTKEEQALLRFQ